MQSNLITGPPNPPMINLTHLTLPPCEFPQAQIWHLSSGYSLLDWKEKKYQEEEEDSFKNNKTWGLRIKD